MRVRCGPLNRMDMCDAANVEIASASSPSSGPFGIEVVGITVAAWTTTDAAHTALRGLRLRRVDIAGEICR